MFNRRTLKNINTLTLDASYISQLAMNLHKSEHKDMNIIQEILEAVNDATQSLESIKCAISLDTTGNNE